MSDESSNKPEDQPEIWSPIQPSGAETPFLSEESDGPVVDSGVSGSGSGENPSDNGNSTVSQAPVAPPVAPSYIEGAKRRTLFELWGATFKSVRTNFSAIVQMSATLAVASTGIAVTMLAVVFSQLPDVSKMVAQIQSGDFTALENGTLDTTASAGTPIDSLTDHQLIGIIAALFVGVAASLLMTFVGSGIFYVFTTPRAEDAEAITFGEVRRAFFGSLPRMLMATVAWAGRILLVVGAMLGVLVVGVDVNIVIALTLVIGGGFIIWYSISTSLTAYAVQSSTLSGNKALARSVELVRGAWWRTFWVLFATNVVVSMFASAVSGLVPMPVSVLDMNATIPWAYLALFGTSTFISSLVAVPLSSITIAHYFRDRNGS